MRLIDLGNTNAKIYTNDEVIKVATHQIYDYLDSEEQIYLCSVVPKVTSVIEKEYPNVNIIDNKHYKNMFENSSQLMTKGVDRLIAAYGAVNTVSEKVLVVDIGSCVTLDLVEGSKYISGLIYPGFQMLENLLEEKIEQLPKAKYGEQKIATDNQIYWANIYGFVGALNSMIDNLITEQSIAVVFTGGSVIKFKEEYDFDLLRELKIYNPIYIPDLIKLGMEQYIEKGKL